MNKKSYGQEYKDRESHYSKPNNIIVTEETKVKKINPKIIFYISILVVICLLTTALFYGHKSKNGEDRGNTVGNTNDYGFCTEEDGLVYFSNFIGDKSIVYKMNGDRKTQLIKEDNANVLFLNVTDGWIYYSKADLLKRDSKGLPMQSIICKIKINGTQRTELATTGILNHLSVVDGWIYYSYLDSNNTQIICKMKTDGSKKTEVFNTNKLIINFNVVGNWMYYVEVDNQNNTSRIYKQRVEGGEKKELVKEESLDLLDLNVEDEYIYYKKADKKTKAATIYKMKTDGTKETEISKEDSCAWSILNVTDSWIYYMKNIKDAEKPAYRCTIYKMKTDGSQKKEIYNKNLFLSSINIAGDWIYYNQIDNGNSEMHKMKLDGSDDTIA